MPVLQMGSKFYDKNSKYIGNKLAKYFSNEGTVPFKYNYV